MNLPNKITVARLFLTIIIILLLCIPFSFFGFNFPKYDINGVTVQIKIPASDNTNTATAADDILDGSNSGTEVKYSPYTSQ